MTSPVTTPHRYGWKPSLPDINDVGADVSGLQVLGEVDPRTDMPPVYDQGQLGSCTAHAIAGAYQYDLMLDENPLGSEIPSRLFIYYQERLREGTVTSDAGAWGRDGFKALRKTGVCSEETWPYDINRFTEKPSEEAYVEARPRRIKHYVHPGLGRDKLGRVEAFKRLLSNRQTIAFGFTVFESFEFGSWQDGVMPLPEAGEKVLGGHEVLLVGYLADRPDCGLCRNSWGTNWGMSGYFLMPWSFLVDERYSGDWRSIYREAGE